MQSSARAVPNGRPAGFQWGRLRDDAYSMVVYWDDHGHIYIVPAQQRHLAAQLHVLA